MESALFSSAEPATLVRQTDDAEADARLLLRGGAPARAIQDLLVQRHGLSKREAYAMVIAVRDG